MSLVPHDSSLRNVPTSLDRKAVLYLDGIRYSLQIFELAAGRLAGTLDGLSQTKPDPLNLSHIIAGAMSDAWMMIDSLHRLRELLQQVPRLKKNEPQLQLFLRRTASVEELRNFFQHFRTEINNFAERGMPLWGTLSWAYLDKKSGELQGHIIAPGTFYEGIAIASCTFDSCEQKFVERVVLHAGPKKVDLADINEWTAEFATWYANWFGLTFPATDHHMADVHIKLRFRTAMP